MISQALGDGDGVSALCWKTMRDTMDEKKERKG
jgi:hypothetical protein